VHNHLIQLLPAGGVADTDAATVLLAFTPSATEGFGSNTDTDTERLALTGSAVEGVEYTDVGTDRLAFTVSALEEHTTYDSGNVALLLKPTSLDHVCIEIAQFTATQVGLRWTAGAATARWNAGQQTLRWNGQVIEGVINNPC
jgi:hypothetical protein